MAPPKLGTCRAEAIEGRGFRFRELVNHIVSFMLGRKYKFVLSDRRKIILRSDGVDSPLRQIWIEPELGHEVSFATYKGGEK